MTAATRPGKIPLKTVRIPAFDAIPSTKPGRFFRALFTALAATVITAVGAWAQAAPTFTNVTVHDPSVVHDGSTYYVFGSHLASASTTDLMNWTQLTRDWDTTTNPTNSLIRNSSPQTEFATALGYTTPPDFWAPDVIKLGDGHYYFYYCVCNGTSRAALGLATANAITGPYSNVSILLESGMTGLSPDGTTYNNAVHPNVVDPSVFFDHAGKLWMVYGSYSGGIFILSLDPTTGQPVAGQAYGKKLIGGNNSTIEGPYIIYSPESAYYYLFFTFGGLDSTGGYNIRVGRSHNPDGPFLDAAGNDLTNVKGAPNTVFDNASIAPYGVKLMGNYQFLHVATDPQTTSRGYVSPGGTSATYDPATGKYLMVFHTRFVGRGEQHEVRVHQMFLNADGWMVVAPQRYAQETISTTDASQISGDFKLINHGKDITATVKNSSVITLNADQSITGAVSGTWQLSGDHFATLTLAGVNYHGVFVRLWDDDNQVWTLTFTVMSGDGVSVWGSKVTSAAATTAPAITTQPSGQTVTTGSSVTFSAAATGSPGPTFQWRKDGVAIPGATNPSYSIGSVVTGDAGSYTVVATNSVGAAISANAVLTVSSPAIPGRVLGDFDGDGKADLFWTNTTTGERTMWFLNGNAMNGGASVGVVPVAWTISARGDFNGDAKTDIFLTNTTTGDRVIWLMNGSNIQTNAFMGTVPTEWVVSGTGDFNGDGKADIFWTNTLTGDRAIWLMNGSTVVGGGYMGTVPIAWKISGSGDFNGDGMSDLVWSNTATGEHAMWFLNGSTVIGGNTLNTLPLAWTISGVGDFNGDGKADIVLTNTTTGDRVIWLMNGSIVTTNAFIGTVPTAWVISSVGDFNGDGKADIFWTNSATGDRAMWLMNGSTVIGGGFMGTVPVEWKISN